MRTWFVIFAIALVTVVYSIAVMVHMLVFRDPAVFFVYARSWSRLLLRLSGVTVVLHGKEHLRAGKRFVYAANHASLFDIPIVLACVPDNIRIMYKQELEQIPVFGWALKLSPFVPVNRDRSREAARTLDAVVESLSSGASVMVFPEGTRSETGELGVFRRGAMLIAVRSKTSIMPVSIVGSNKILPARSKILRGGTVHVWLEGAVEVADIQNIADEKALVDEVRTTIDARLDQLELAKQ